MELQISLKKSNLCKFLMDSKDLYIYGSVKTYTIFIKKIAAILNFHVNMPPSWILCVFGPFKKKIFSSFVCITAQYYVVNYHAAYSAEETINKIKLLSLPIKSLL